MDKARKFKTSFYVSLLLGFVLWFLCYILLPINTISIAPKTIVFITCSVLSLILGFNSFSIKKFELKIFDQQKNVVVKSLLALLFVSLLFRYVDLFYYRELSLKHPFYQNKLLSYKNSGTTPLIVSFFGSLRSLYFVPLLFLITSKIKSKKLWLFSILIIILFSIEILLFGTRRPLFHLFVLIIIALSITVNRKVLVQKTNLLIALLIAVLLGVFSYIVLNKRVNEHTNGDEHLVKVIDSRYNDFVEIKDEKIKQFYKEPNRFRTKYELLLIHTGQYIVHGFYELDYIINMDLPRAYGKYSFNPVFKFFNRIGLSRVNLNTRQFHPRDYVYVSFFGSYFIDFGWFSLIIFFIYGVFQKLIVSFAENNPLILVLWVFTVCINLFMPMFNLLSGTELYLQVFLVLSIIVFTIIFRNNYFK